LLELFFVAISVLAFTVARLIECHVGRLTVELDILGLPLSDNNWILEVDMDYHNKLTNTRLEEKVLDVGKDHIDMIVP
jgi:hypothetical protein